MKYYTYLKKITYLFLILFPLTGLTFFHHNLTNLFICLYILFVFISLLFLNKDCLKLSKYVFLFYLLCFIYLGISFLLSKNFISLIPNNYSLYKEFLTILKLMMPVTFFFSLKYLNYSSKEYLNILKIWTLFISLSIIISNIFNFSLRSYGDGKIIYNIFHWSKDKYYQYTASKGYFTFANQVSVILLSLLIVLFKEVLTKKSNILYIILTGISMLMLGTRVSALGGFLTLISLFCFYFLITLFKKNKINKNIYLILIPIIIWGSLLPISPFFNRKNELDQVIVNDINNNYEKENLREEKDEVDEKIQYVIDHYNPNYLPKMFWENYYPIQYDQDFWYEFVKNTKIENMHYRLIEEAIIRRMIEINNKKITIFFGISNNRIQNVVNLERDFVLQYYAFGIIGSLILLGLYLYLLVKNVYYFFKDQDYLTFTYASCILLFIFAAFLTGNIINSLYPIISFIFIISYQEET